MQQIGNIRDSSNNFFPEDKSKYMLVCREEVQDKNFAEKAVDLLLTFGNNRYREYYYYIVVDSDGNTKIQERIYEDEKNAAAFRGVELFDYRDEVKQKIRIFARILDYTLNQSEYNKQKLIDELENLIDSKGAKMIIDDIGKLSGLGTSLVAGGISGITQVSYIAIQTYRVVNNALIKEGIKGFMSIGGAKMMVEGTKVAVTQAGKKLAEGTVVGVTKEGGKNVAVRVGTQATKTGFSCASLLKGLGIGLAVNAVVGVVKASINSGWTDERKIVCDCHPNFDFELINDTEQKLESLKQQITKIDCSNSQLENQLSNLRI